MAGTVFLNYRRGDDPGFTHALYQHLESEFTAGQLFMDVQGHIQPGDDFVEVLGSQVAGADIVLVVVGPRWLELMADLQASSEDFVVIEIQAALEAGKRVIPALVGGAKMPRADQLPETIRTLARRNAVELRPEHFKADCRELVTALKGQLTKAEAARAAAADGQVRAAEQARSLAAEEAARIETARSLENRKWTAAREQGDSASLRAFLAEFPDGPHAQTARAQLVAIESREAEPKVPPVRPAEHPAVVRSPAPAAGPTTKPRDVPSRDDGFDPPRRHANSLRDLPSSLMPVAIAPSFVLGAVGVAGGALDRAFHLDRSTFVMSGGDHRIWEATGVGVLLLGAFFFFTDTGRGRTLVASVSSAVGWFVGGRVGLQLAIMSVEGRLPIPAAMFLWGVLNWLVPAVAVALIKPGGRRRLIWGVPIIGGLASLYYADPTSLAQTTSTGFMIMSALYIGVPMACIGYLLTPRRDEPVSGDRVS